MRYCDCYKHHLIELFLCDHQYLTLKQYALNSCKWHGPRQDVTKLLLSGDFSFICDKCKKCSCVGIRRNRLEKYINTEITFQSFILHAA